jgi:hypothetical protein
MRYDERYTPYVRETRLLPFIQLVSRSTPPLNAAAITALTDRWRPETHSFHLRTGEMTVTLQDIAMIAGLPIEGNPLCMSTDSDGWREQVHALIGMVPPEPRNQKQKTRRRKESQPVLLSPGLHSTFVLALRMLMRMRSRHMLVHVVRYIQDCVC